MPNSSKSKSSKGSKKAASKSAANKGNALGNKGKTAKGKSKDKTTAKANKSTKSGNKARTKAKTAGHKTKEMKNSPWGLGAKEYAEKFKEMGERVQAWGSENGFIKATGGRGQSERSQRGSGGDDPRFRLLDRPSNGRLPWNLRGSDPAGLRVREWIDLAAFANERGFVVTSTTGDEHNPGSSHSKGLAVDVRTKDKSQEEGNDFIREAQSRGIKVRDERVRPKGQKVWSGPHIHLSAPLGWRDEVGRAYRSYMHDMRPPKSVRGGSILP